MARTLEQIQTSMITELQATELGASLTSTSGSALWRLLLFVVSMAIYTLEGLWDIFKEQVDALIAQNQAHTQDWYRNKALGFLLGVPVIPGTDKFNITELSDEAIAAAKVVKQAAAIKLYSANGYGILRIKLAGGDGEGNLQPLTVEALTAADYYMRNHVVDAGTQLEVTSGMADKLLLDLDVYFDPKILNSFGQRLDGTNNTPVQNAIDDFLKNISFNGRLNIEELKRAIRNVQGVVENKANQAASKYGDYTYDQQGIPNVGPIDIFRVADSGYLVIDELNINWIPVES